MHTNRKKLNHECFQIIKNSMCIGSFQCTTYTKYTFEFYVSQCNPYYGCVHYIALVTAHTLFFLCISTCNQCVHRTLFRGARSWVHCIGGNTLATGANA